tara:strand:+ start:604 stop:1047 length:444 start_codon:yes stop_codon:yes gene_type:complete
LKNNFLILIFIYLSISIVQADISIRKHNDLYCYDGDTCYVEIDGKIRHENGELIKIRLLELDTPEISKPKCDQELEWGLKARDYVNNLIENAKSIEIETDFSIDNKYFNRILAHLIVDGENASALIVKNNLGVVYDKNNKKDWCSAD